MRKFILFEEINFIICEEIYFPGHGTQTIQQWAIYTSLCMPFSTVPLSVYDRYTPANVRKFIHLLAVGRSLHKPYSSGLYIHYTVCLSQLCPSCNYMYSLYYNYYIYSNSKTQKMQLTKKKNELPRVALDSRHTCVCSTN